MKEYLDSDRVNFLIWRYLIEANYRETAVKFQKEWHIEEPHRQLDFAHHVKSHALVNVINKGLIFSSLERDFAQSQAPQNAAAKADATELGVFGPVLAERPLRPNGEHREENAEEVQEPPGDLDHNRKRPNDRPQESLLNGSPVKRPRLSNGYENGNGVDAATDPMELDRQPNHDNHAYPSPLEGELAPTPILRTDGPEQGTQIDKVEELAPTTTFIPLGQDEALASSPLSATNPVARSNSENAPVLLHCQWNPKDPTVLAAAGTDALARLWTISRATTSDPAAGHVNGAVPPYHSLIEEDLSPKATVTAMAWNLAGTAIAVATDSDTKARLSIWGADGTEGHHFEGAEPPIVKIRWNPSGVAILSISPENDKTLVTVHDMMSANTIVYPLVGHDLHADGELDAAWTSDNGFILAGGDLLVSLKCVDGQIVETKKFEAREGDSLTQVHFDPIANLAATCSEKGFVDIWDESGKRREIKAHDGAVTALEWQPLEALQSEGERLLASGGEDGAIFVWNALSLDGKPKCSMTMGLPIVALAFTPDGAFIAGATNERILIWKVGDHSIPRASWSRMPHPGWLSPRMSDDPEDEPEHSLCWDASGHKLVYGVNSRLAIVHFR